MAQTQIDDAYIRDFFGIGSDAAGDRELADIRKKLRRITFEHGQDICTIDEKPDGLFFLESGSVVVLDRDGEQINLLHEGSYFGEYAVLSRTRRLSTVRAYGRCAVLKLSNEDTADIIARHPGIYGELMKRVYSQVSRKHAQLLNLSRIRRGILQDAKNRRLMTPKQIAIHYGLTALVFILSLIFVPKGSTAPVFLLPLALMLAYVLVTRRTLESLVVSGMFAAMLSLRTGVSASYADALMTAMGNYDNVFTVLVMALMGGVVMLIEASGAVTAFKKRIDRRVKTRTGAKLSMVGILAITAIDDCLNMMCASTSARSAADRLRVPREETALLLSFLPTTLTSFVPFSLWGIFVIGTVNGASGGNGVGLFCRAIPLNFFSILAVLSMLLLCFGKLIPSKRLTKARQRVASGGELWPEGSERWLVQDDEEVWGKPWNLLAVILVLAASSLLVRLIFGGSFALDSACGLVFTLIFMFFLYCVQGLMTPEEFSEHLIAGIQSMALPIVLYLLTMCLSTLLETEGMGAFFDRMVMLPGMVVRMFPAVLFLVSALLTLALGSSWAMFAIAFPVAVRMGTALGLSLPLLVGAVCAAGIAGEKCCGFTSDAESVGSAIGCDPGEVWRGRWPYSLLFTVASFVLYLIAGLLA